MSEPSVQKIKENSIILHKLPPLSTKQPIKKLPINSPIRTRNIFQQNILSPMKLEDNEMSTFENSKIKASINNNVQNYQKLNSNETIKSKRFNSPIRTKKPLTLNIDRFAPKISRNTNNNKKVRVDRNGIEINHKNKKSVKVTFIDQIDSVPFTEIIEIESIKRYNYISGMPNEDKYVRDTCCNASCKII